MTSRELHQAADSAAEEPPRAEEHRLLEEIKAKWSAGEPANAEEAIARYEQLRERKSLVVDLAYEEYCRRVANGETIERAAFLARFPAFAHSLARRLDVHEYLSRHGFLASLAPIEWPQIGQRFLGFEIIEELGRGAFARVYLATEHALGSRKVAIKVASQGSKEAETLGRLEHPNVVPIHAVLEDPATGLTAIVMPYLGGTTLGDLLDDVLNGDSRDFPRPWSREFVEAVLRIGIKLCEALEFTHGKGILHRDLKPSNILLPQLDVPMLLDFNLATRTDGQNERAGGTLPYMAPEQLEIALGKATTLDGRVDVFGLGVVLFELLTGVLPFQPDEPNSAESQLAARTASLEPALRKLRSVADGGITEVVGKCLHKDPALRPQTAGELATALQKCLAPQRRVVRWLTQHRRGVMAALLILSLVAALANGWALARPPAHVRAHRQGIEQMRNGNHASAVESFSQALAVSRGIESLVARGRAYAHMGDRESDFLTLAAKDFREASEISPNPRIAALRGFCLAKLANHKSAIVLYQQAQSGGFDSPELWNDLGYSFLQTAKLDEARKAFDRAIAGNNRLQAAYVNRAKLVQRQSLQDTRFPKEAIDDLRAALSLGVHPDILRDNIQVLALAAATDETYWARVVEALNDLHDHGGDKARALKDPLLASLKTRPESESLRSSTESRETSGAPFPRIVDPLGPPSGITAD